MWGVMCLQKERVNNRKANSWGLGGSHIAGTLPGYKDYGKIPRWHKAVSGKAFLGMS